MSDSTDEPVMDEKLKPIEFYVIGGYLGAGKTTLLNHLLQHSGLTNTAVLINDFGKINIDAELIKNVEGETYRLENGCICCNIGQAFFTTLLQVVKSSPPPERIIIEASGVADPSRIADIARLSPSMRLHKVVVMVDCAMVREYAADPQVDSIVIQQLKSADLFLLNKCDLVEDRQLEKLGAWIAEINPQAEQIPCKQADIEVSTIFDFKPTTPLDGTPASGDTDNINFTDVEDQSLLVNWNVSLPQPIEKAALSRAIQSLPKTVHRVKGFLSIKDHEGSFLVQYTPGQLNITSVETEPSEELLGQLVFIGTRQNPSTDDFMRMLD